MSTYPWRRFRDRSHLPDKLLIYRLSERASSPICRRIGYHEEMSNYFDNFREAYGQTTLEFGVADIFTDDSADVAARVGSFVLLMNQATLGKNGSHIRGVLVVAPPVDSKLGCDQTEIERETRSATEALFKREISEQEQGSLSKFVHLLHSIQQATSD